MALGHAQCVGRVTPKKGNLPEECDDRIRCPSVVLPAAPFCVAVADGATEGILNGQWAEAIVQSCTTAPFPRSRDDVRCMLTEARAAWIETVSNYRRNRQSRERPIQWYEEPGLQTGSFSTLVCLIVDPHQGRRVLRRPKTKKNLGSPFCVANWWACAVGDSCLFEVSRDGRLRNVAPLTASGDFNSSPHLISTRDAPPPNVLVDLCGNSRKGDRIYLMTDAIACWTLRQVESGKAPWRQLDAALGSEECFLAMVGKLRADRRMRNDDVAVIRVAF